MNFGEIVSLCVVELLSSGTGIIVFPHREGILATLPDLKIYNNDDVMTLLYQTP